MAIAYSLAYNAVILPVTPGSAGQGALFQVSASRNDREVPRYLSPAWSEPELRAAFAAVEVTESQFQELLRGNRRATGGRYPRRLLFTQEQLQSMGLHLDPAMQPGQTAPAEEASEHAAHEVQLRVFPDTAEPFDSSGPADQVPTADRA